MRIRKILSSILLTILGGIILIAIEIIYTIETIRERRIKRRLKKHHKK